MHRTAAIPLNTVEALDAERMKVVVQTYEPGRWYVHTRLSRQGMSYILPRADISVVISRRKLAYPQRAVHLREVGLGRAPPSDAPGATNTASHLRNAFKSSIRRLLSSNATRFEFRAAW
jgi:hypothetical protein